MGIRIKQATKDGYIEVADGGIVDLSYPNSKTRRGRVQGGGMLCPTITASANGLCRVEVLYGRDCDECAAYDGCRWNTECMEGEE